MVGLVVVSHSHALARAAVDLAEQMLPAADDRRVPVAVAAGLDDTTFGTDAVRIADAISEVDQGAGVVVLMDLGSAVLSAELALDLLDDEIRGRVVLCPAPLVEGLIVAVVTAASGAPREEVAAEAAAALTGKQSQLKAPTPGLTGSTSGEVLGDVPGELRVRFTVSNQHGLHARPAARLVRALRAFDAQVQLRNLTTGSAWASGASLSMLTALGAGHGHTVEATASGTQAREALDQLLALAERGFDDPVRSDADLPRPGEGAGPLAAAPGVGIGPARPLRFSPVAVPDAAVTAPNVRGADPEHEWQHLQESLTAVRREVRRVRTGALRTVADADAALFDAHLLLLEDTELLDDVRARIVGGQIAAAAWSAAVDAVGARLAALPDPYLRARAADLRAVRDQVLRALLGTPSTVASPDGVLVTADLTPAEAAELDPDRVAAVLLAYGSPTAHSAILLRGRGVPAVVGAGPGVLDIAEGTLLAVDGTLGTFLVDPPPNVVAAWQDRATELARRDRRDLAAAAAPAITRDGVPVLVGATVGAVQDARLAAACGADLAGLVRTEFLFLGRSDAPDVDEQEAAYQAIAEALGGRRITLRTLDSGADKPLDYLSASPEANPFLGVRGIRLSLTHPELLTDQLLAMVRVAHDVPVSILFPMVTALGELRQARRLLDRAVELDGRERPAGLRVGIMVEVPATALKASVFAPQVDFLSIGTNDLTQYALAAERGNPAVAPLGDPYDPGVLRLIRTTCRAAGDQTPVAVCGELAADAQSVGLLVGLGLRELSVTPRAIPTIKQHLRALHTEHAAMLTTAALDADSPDAVRAQLSTPPPMA